MMMLDMVYLCNLFVHVYSYVPVNLETVQEYQDHLAQFIQTYSVDYPQYKVCVDYIVDTWIKPNSTKPLAVHFLPPINKFYETKF